jgi:hypothetical protein
MTEPHVAEHADGALTLWIDGHPFVLRDSAEYRRGLYGGWAAAWRSRAAGYWLVGQADRGRVWVQLADGAEAMCRRVEEGAS